MTCPYFVGNKHECDLTVSGMFVPSPTEIATFCSSRFYLECSHFLKGSPLYNRTRGGGENALASHGGRRRYVRFKGQFPVSLREDFPGGNMLADFAIAMNYGTGGVCVESRRKLPQDRPIVVRFGRDFIVPNLQEKTRVCWQTLDQHEHQWIAGLAFEDIQLNEAICLKVNM